MQSFGKSITFFMFWTKNPFINVQNKVKTLSKYQTVRIIETERIIVYKIFYDRTVRII